MRTHVSIICLAMLTCLVSVAPSISLADEAKTTLVVKKGKGGGEYAPGTEAKVTANEAREGWVFSHWVGEIALIKDIFANPGTVTVKKKRVAVEAVFRRKSNDEKIELKVTRGDGEASYPKDCWITIQADNPPTGKKFVGWTGENVEFHNDKQPLTLVKINKAPASVKAEYK